MKLSLVGLVALLAATSTATPVASPVEASIDAAAAGWRCDFRGGGGHDTLRRTHSQFNRKFGNPRLRMAGRQCYVVKCYDHYFGVCNSAAYGQTEKSGVRNVAKNASPGSGSACKFNSGVGLNYVFGHVRHLNLGGGNDIRHC
ncbi:hypothetical protein RJZ56_004770 [Blastomyces dermatitidis]|uniref:Secreted protein n=3 Tax=Blastomyces TaxID=229219 RepID=A0A179UY96_BLAGS|nr:uncharacterized protein BDBG_08327 [Blastomyces gilchristii SLH14081]XP_045276754.1 uncharacterized protein BDCG_05046 [Blastomyces dermatitidis ER-3]EGE80970.1 hypothetical protein BDDG_03911 [Blastomyces dermatitidis ATCC 18188]EQL37803.1 hypothetical protein BDFG_00851 [Blastomyces dermatitidis ATCC 26199]EEQ89926.2 hypothetical protein BDCG_05046 [Blastomyces dermatitidis ER-3]OAT13054.1 hypothetical protein BDBG_08327 [Blastomyces gilchristii SLH14081]